MMQWYIYRVKIRKLMSILEGKNIMRRQQLILLVVIIFIVGIGIGITLRLFAGSSPTIPQNKLSAEQIQGTASAEERFIAQMTADPASVAQMTPYYGEVLFSRALRNNTSGSQGDCTLAADVWRLNFTDDFMVASLASSFGEARAQTLLSVVWHSATCGEYLPVSSSTIIIATEPQNIECPLRTIVDAFNTQFKRVRDLPAQKSNVVVQIIIDDTTSISTNLVLIEAAILNNLSCGSLPDALRVPS